MANSPRFAVGDAVRFRRCARELIGIIDCIWGRGREHGHLGECDCFYGVYVEHGPGLGGKPCIHPHVPERDVAEP